MTKKFLVLILFTLLLYDPLLAEKAKVEFVTTKGGDHTEVGTEPSVNYDGDNNSLEVTIDAPEFFEMKVIDFLGNVVYTCPVLMTNGVPTNYQLPPLEPGVYTLRVQSPSVTYEGIHKIE